MMFYNITNKKKWSEPGLTSFLLQQWFNVFLKVVYLWNGILSVSLKEIVCFVCVKPICNGLNISMSLTLLYPVRRPPLYFPSVCDRWFGEGRGGAFRTTRTRRPSPRCCSSHCPRRRSHYRRGSHYYRSPGSTLGCRPLGEQLTTNSGRSGQRRTADHS